MPQIDEIPEELKNRFTPVLLGNKIATENTFGVLVDTTLPGYKKNLHAKESTSATQVASCHYSLNATIFSEQSMGANYYGISHLYISCTVPNQKDNPKAVAQSWFEWILDPNKSPWKDLFSFINFYVLRDKDGFPTYIIVEKPYVNSVILFSWFKAFRQIREGKFLEYFHYVVSKTKVGDDFVTEAAVISLFFNYAGELSLGHDHSTLKEKVSKNFFDKKIVADFKLYQTFKTNYYYGSSNMQREVFGGGEGVGNLIDLDKIRDLVRSHYYNKKMKGGIPTYLKSKGYLAIRQDDQSIYNPTVNLEDLKSLHKSLIPFLTH